MRALRAVSLPAAVLLLSTLIWVALLVSLHLQDRAGMIDPLENRLLDLRYKLTGTRSAAPEIVLVSIDDATLDTGGADPTGRARLVRLVNTIADSGAQALALDVLLADAGRDDERAALAEALARLPTVIAAAVRFDPDGAATVVWPHPAFRAAAEVGLVNLSTDATGTPRYMPMFIAAEGAVQPALPLLAALSLVGGNAQISERALVLGTHRIPLDAGGNLPLRLLGPAGTVPTISAAALLEGSLPDALSGKLVVLGFSAAGMGDRFVTPFDDDVPGAEIIATAISQLLGGTTLRHDAQTRDWSAVHAALLAMLCVAVMLWVPLIPAIALTLALVLASFAAVTLFFAQGLWLSAALPLVAAIPPAVGAYTLRLLRERSRARRSAQSLASLRRFQSPALARRIESDPDYLSTPQAQDLVIFFVDLTGFTALSQDLGPEGTRALLQRFHGLTTDAVEERGGCVINYMGDGALAVFGLEPPQEAQSDADAALASAETLQGALGTIPVPPRVPALACRIGLHHGPVVMSRLGADSHQQVSVTGDTVNLASRLMEVAKQEGARIVASSDFTDRLSADAPMGQTRQAQIAVRGRSGHVAVVIWPIDPA